MRIGIVTKRFGLNNGQGRVNYEIAAEALRRGHQVSPFCEYVEPALANTEGVHSELLPNGLVCATEQRHGA